MSWESRGMKRCVGGARNDKNETSKHPHLHTGLLILTKFIHRKWNLNEIIKFSDLRIGENKCTHIYFVQVQIRKYVSGII